MPAESYQTSDEVSMETLRDLKLTPFWDFNPWWWFATTESKLLADGIRSKDTMYRVIVKALSPDVLQEVADVIALPPSPDKYKKLKHELTRRFCEKNLMNINDEYEKPSELLDLMKNVANCGLDEEQIRPFWLQRMPANVKQVLSVCEERSLTELALLADKIVEISTPGCSDSPDVDLRILSLEGQVRELRSLVDELKNRLS